MNNYNYDMVNKTFNMLTVLDECKERKRRLKIYKCLCECGNITYVTGYDLRSGKTKSCGCLSKINHQSLQEWADELGVPKSRLQNRYYRHWSDKEILLGRDV